MAYNDQELTCRDCSGTFVWTAGEQEFYAGKGLQHPPSRCPSCRATRKMMRPEDRDETPHFGVYVSWGGRTPRQLHKTTCSGCAQVAEVPFVPRGDRPIYCSECYNKERERQQAQEEAAAVAAAARITSAGRREQPELEGDGTSRGFGPREGDGAAVAEADSLGTDAEAVADAAGADEDEASA